MRKRLLGAIAAVAAGAGAAVGQAPIPAPVPLGPAGPLGGYPGGLPAGTGGDPVPLGAAGPGMDPGGMGGGPGGPPPTWPAPGVYGQPQWQPPFVGSHPPSWASRTAPHVWAGAETLLWFTKSQPTNGAAYAVTSAPGDGGILGAPTTRILSPSNGLGYGMASGFRVTGGFFYDDDRRDAWYASGFLTEQRANVFTAQSDATGQPLLGRPFINAATLTPTVLLASFPTYAAGSISVYSSTRAWGAESGPMLNVFRSCPDRGGLLWDFNLTTAFRYFELKEDLVLASSSSLLPGATAPFDGKLYGSSATIAVRDQFDAVNRFFGGQVGFQSQLYYNRAYFLLSSKVAAGLMHQTVTINGTSTLTTPTNASVASGGLFANAGNIGKSKQDEFAVIPEVGATFGYQWLSWFSTHIGYNGLYISRVARPGNQFVAAVNPVLIPTSPSYGNGPAVPVPNPAVQNSTYWLQGATVGFNIRY